MMTPKEKAEELVDKYFETAKNIEWTSDEEKKEKAEKYNDDLGNDVLIYWNELAKKSALIAVDEILEYLTSSIDIQVSLMAIDYWQEVKQEINNL